MHAHTNLLIKIPRNDERLPGLVHNLRSSGGAGGRESCEIRKSCLSKDKRGSPPKILKHPFENSA